VTSPGRRPYHRVVLAALGLGPAEEEVYRRLVGQSGATAAVLGEDTGRCAGELEAVLAALVDRGLAVAQAPACGGGTVYRAAPPAVTLGALLRQRHDDLRAAEVAMLALVEEHRAATAGHAVADIVEVITDLDAVRHRFAQIQEGARHEVLSMVVPDLRVVPHRENVAGDAGLRRGVRYRCIVDRGAMAEPDMVADAIASSRAGEQIRVADRVPVKLVIADGEVAMLPLMRGRNTAAASLLVHGSGLLDALVAFFEASWARAYPLRPEASGAIDELDARVLSLVLAGLTDQAVASQLGMSLRTVQRRLRVLMRKAGVTTRIQLGWYAGRQGWA
jgi:sugar-specific transcriptional regulator TrmB/DNA-binding CsgD family transcriptional regulator